MRPLNTLFCDNLEAKNYWYPFDYRNEHNQVPKETGTYQVMIYFTLSGIMIMAEVEWDGKDWIYGGCDCVTNLVRCWKEENNMKGCGWVD